MIGDGAYPSLLQGVSQQILQNRIEGQLTAQKNMLSDIVTGLRRRPGSEFKKSLSTTTGTDLKSMYLELGSEGYHIYINPLDGKLRAYNDNWDLVHTTTDTYLIAADVNSLRTVTQGGYTYFANTEQAPTVSAFDTSRKNPIYHGFCTILTGAYSKAYSIKLKCTGLNATYTYSTPDGSAAGDVDKSTPDYIATQLVTAILADATATARLDVYKDGPYIYVTKDPAWGSAFGELSVTTTAGNTYAQASGTMVVPLSTNLPANLPAQANGIICAVGSNPSTYAYYRWDDAAGAWIESGAYDSVETLQNMPSRLKVVNGVFTYEHPVFEGRLAGSATSNPYAAFLTFGITGLSAYQGRLVILSGGFCNMSASNRPLRFMRSTVVDLIDDDPIEISAGAVASADFRSAIPFNKDLVLISASHQAVVPAGSTSLTPKNARVVLSSTEAVGVLAEPQVMGRTLIYSTAVSPEFFGAGEMLPSQYSDSQYSANNLTAHIPRYIAGSCRGIVSNSAVSTGVLLSTSATKECLVNEYLWAGDERVQNAWHKWEFPLDVLSIHSAKGAFIIAFKNLGEVLFCSLDTRSASYKQQGYIPTFADARSNATVVDNTFYLPTHLRNAALVPNIILAQSAGVMAGEPVGIVSINTSTWLVTTVRSFPAGTVSVGLAFESAVTPSSALLRDNERRPVLTANTNILRYLVNVANTGEFNVTTTITGYDDTQDSTSALLWSSSELGLSQKKAVEYGTVIVPVRAYTFDTDTTLSTSSTRELNIVSIEYTLRGVIKRKRI